jgi:phosphatidylglycerophosphate synthase
VRTIRAELLAGLLVQTAVLAALTATGRLGPVGIGAGLAYAAAVTGLLDRGLRRAKAQRLGPANRITLFRAVLIGGVVALVVDPTGSRNGTLIAALAAVALALDGVDGRVARSTGTVSAVGARFDVEVDSVLVFALSLAVARELGAWVLLVGSVHYLLLAAAAALPWLRRPAPPRYWCKVVAAIQGLVLGVLSTGAIPAVIAVPLLGGVAALLAESFGRETWWLWRARPRETAPCPEQTVFAPAGG